MGNWINYSWRLKGQSYRHLYQDNLLLTKYILNFHCCAYISIHPNNLQPWNEHINISAPTNMQKTFRKSANRWHTSFIKKKKKKLPHWILVFEYQSFSRLEAGNPLAAPGCGGKATAGSPWVRCCRGTERAGTEWCGRWLGLCTPGQTRWRLGDSVRAQRRSGGPAERISEWSFDRLTYVFSRDFVSQMLARVDERLTQVGMEKKEKAMTARAASPVTMFSLGVLDHWLARTQKQMNHRNVHAAVPQ